MNPLRLLLRRIAKASSAPRTGAILFVLFCFVVLTSASGSAQERVFEQDDTLNNLVHAEGYTTAPLGTLGRVERRGSGARAMVLIPGLGFGGGVFEEFMADHEEAYTLYAVTLPGFAGTSAPPMPAEGTSYGEQTWIRAAAEAVAAFMEEEGLVAPVLVGHLALGTQVALRVALDHPDQIGGVVLLSGEPVRPVGQVPLSEMEPDARRQAIDAFLAPGWFITVTKETWDSNMWPPEIYATEAATAQDLWDAVARVPLPVMVRYLCEFLAYDITREFANLSVPVLAVVPGFTESIRANAFYGSAVQFHQTIWEQLGWPGDPIEQVQVEHAHLFIMNDQPAALSEALQAFMDALE